MIYIDLKMPKSCKDCKLEVFEECVVTGRPTELADYCKVRPLWCPLHFESNDLSDDEYHRNVAGLSDW